MQNGGELLGYGKQDSIVVTIDELEYLFTDTQRWCAYLYPDERSRNPVIDCVNVQDDRGHAKWRHLERVLEAQDGDVAIKYIESGDPTRELKNNALVRRWFHERRADRGRLTTLHPRLERIDVFHTDVVRQVLKKSTMLAMRACNGDLHHLLREITRGNYGNDSEGKKYKTSLLRAMLFRVARGVLEFLAVAHGHGYLHMDVKPRNILWFRERKMVREDVRDARGFCLGDYGDMHEAVRVVSQLLPRSGGPFGAQKDEGPEELATHMSVGTEGYMSPLLKKHGDDRDRVYRMFRDVLGRHQTPNGASGAKSDGDPPDAGDPDAAWAAYFTRAKRDLKKNYRKIDLHSLALTLLHCVNAVHARLGADLGADSPPSEPGLFDFIARLMFFRESRDFFTAEAALAYLSMIELLDAS
jgi:serine/threonine protein kinase